nr:hypothetical protein [Inhella crocodyli]
MPVQQASLSAPPKELLNVLRVLGEVAFLAGKGDVGGLVAATFGDRGLVVDMSAAVQFIGTVSASVAKRIANSLDVGVGVSASSGCRYPLAAQLRSLGCCADVRRAMSRNVRPNTSSALRSEVPVWRIAKVFPRHGVDVSAAAALLRLHIGALPIGCSLGILFGHTLRASITNGHYDHRNTPWQRKDCNRDC